MNSRYELQSILEKVLGSRNVYFQPPPSIKLAYPAIIYSRSELQNRYADDSVYSQNCVYKLTLIDKDPDSPLVGKISQLPFCKHVQNYKSDNLNHDVFTIYFKGDL